MKKFFVKTFGCAQNTADSERIKTFYWQKGYEESKSWQMADLVVINTCIIRESAENRAYGLINLIDKLNGKRKNKIKIIVTGCLTGLAVKDKTNKKLTYLKKRFPMVDQFLPIEKISFKIDPLRDKRKAALIPISSGCDNFCSYCIVPFSRGKEVSRPFEEIIEEARRVLESGFKEVVLVGQNVNSYGSDLVAKNLTELKPVVLKSMGKGRIQTLFPLLLEKVAKMGFEKVSFVSSNPWDFSDKLIEVIAKHKNIDRLLHLPFQAGDDEVLKNMSRGYTKKDYLNLVNKIKNKVTGVKFSTDIIIGFPGEDEKAFENTIDVCKKVGFEIAYLNKYSPRKGTVSAKLFKDEISMKEKKRRWILLNDLVNKKITEDD